MLYIAPHKEESREKQTSVLPRCKTARIHRPALGNAPGRATTHQWWPPRPRGEGERLPRAAAATSRATSGSKTPADFLEGRREPGTHVPAAGSEEPRGRGAPQTPGEDAGPAPGNLNVTSRPATWRGCSMAPLPFPPRCPCGRVGKPLVPPPPPPPGARGLSRPTARAGR